MQRLRETRTLTLRARRQVRQANRSVRCARTTRALTNADAPHENPSHPCAGRAQIGARMQSAHTRKDNGGLLAIRPSANDAEPMSAGRNSLNRVAGRRKHTTVMSKSRRALWRLRPRPNRLRSDWLVSEHASGALECAQRSPARRRALIAAEWCVLGEDR